MVAGPQAILASGEAIGQHYQVVHRLGRGGVGDVYLARDIRLDRLVAIKVLRPDISSRFDSDARMRREARLLSRLSHPNIVVLHAFGTAPKAGNFIVMEYVQGQDLHTRMKARGAPFAADVFQHVFSQVCGAVAEAHRQGIVHRDLKPGNVLIGPHAGDPDYVKVVDFGLAKTFSTGEEAPPDGRTLMTREGAWMGTPRYMAPERAQGNVSGPRTDIYALGVMACELLTGQPPFDAPSHERLIWAHVMDAPRLPSALSPSFPVDGPLDRVIARALAKDPERRPADAAAFCREVCDALRPDLGDVADLPTVTDAGGRRAAQPASPSADTLGWPEPESGDERVAHDVAVLALELDAAYGDVEQEEYLECLAVIGAKVALALGSRDGLVLGPLADSQLALFGLLPGEEHDAERAVDAALAVRAALARLNDDPTIPAAFRPRFRVGIDFGRAYVLRGPGGFAVAQGPGLRGARTVAQGAAEGEIRVSHAVYRRVRGLFEAEPVASSEAGPIRAVAARRPMARRIARSELHGVKTDLIGRDAALGTLRAAIDGAIGGRAPAAIVVHGPTGVGKTRLVARLLDDLQESLPSSILEVGRATPGGSPYEPFVEAIRTRARIEEGDAPPEVSLKLEHVIRQLLRSDPIGWTAEDERLRELLARFLGAGEEAAPEDTVRGDEARRALLFDAVTDVCRRLASRGPLIFVIEDFHWAEAPTRALLDHVLTRIGSVPFAFIITWRTEFGGAPDTSFLRDRSRVTEIPLQALDASAAETLVRHVLRELVEIPPWLTRAICGVAEGVPLIVEEVVHDLIEAGTIAVAEGRWRLAPAAATRLRLPASLDQLFLSRVERLDGPLRATLEAAAVAGRFWASQMEEVYPTAVRGGHLAALVQRGFIVERREVVIAGEPDYGFRQLAVPEAISRGLSRQRRQQLHRAVAHWLERQGRGRSSGHEDWIGVHLREAGEAARALPYLLRAADRAIRTHAVEDALRHLDSCRDIAQSLAQADMPSAEARGLLARIEARRLQQLVLAGRLQQAVAAADSALGSGVLDGSPDERAQVAVARGSALEHLGRYAEALESYAGARETLGTGGRSELYRLLSVTGEAAARAKLGDADASVAALTGAVERAERARTDEPEWATALSKAFRVLGNAQLRRDALAEAEAALRGAYDLALTANAPVEIVDALNGLAALHYYRGQLVEAEAVWRRALDTADRWDLLQHTSVLLTNLGEVECRLGDPGRALATLTRAQALHRHLGSDEGCADAGRLVGECHLALGDVGQARMEVLGALDAAVRVGSPYFVGACHRALARIAYAELQSGQGDPALAGTMERHLSESLAAFEAAGMAGEVAETLAVKAACTSQGQSRP